MLLSYAEFDQKHVWTISSPCKNKEEQQLMMYSCIDQSTDVLDENEHLYNQ
jgi:hypothetical protein